MLYLVRHAKAGDPERWTEDDRLRPLTKAGQRQAEGLVAKLDGLPVDRIMSSAYLRCVQTVQPLADHRGLPLEETTMLAAGAGLESLEELIRVVSGQHAVLCTHADLVGELLDQLAARGVVRDPEPALAKGSTWLLDERSGEIVSARYMPPA